MNGLIIFIKNVEKGKVKTRLAATVGDEEALNIYYKLLAHARKTALAVEVNRYVFYSSFVEKNDEWSNDFFYKKTQTDADLGLRMSDAFKEILKKHKNVVIIGSDCASLTPDILNLAFEKLEEFPFVIGPTFDGGYYLLGMNELEPSVFENVEWSTESVFDTTISRMDGLGKKYFLLPKLSDIDYEEDWVKYGKHLNNNQDFDELS